MHTDFWERNEFASCFPCLVNPVDGFLYGEFEVKPAYTILAFSNSMSLTTSEIYQARPARRLLCTS